MHNQSREAGSCAEAITFSHNCEEGRLAIFAHRRQPWQMATRLRAVGVCPSVPIGWRGGKVRIRRDKGWHVSRESRVAGSVSNAIPESKTSRLC